LMAFFCCVAFDRDSRNWIFRVCVFFSFSFTATRRRACVRGMVRSSVKELPTRCNIKSIARCIFLCNGQNQRYTIITKSITSKWLAVKCFGCILRRLGDTPYLLIVMVEIQQKHFRCHRADWQDWQDSRRQDAAGASAER
jgi:hypothetical protein